MSSDQLAANMSKNAKLAALLGAIAIAFFVAIMVIQSSH